MVNLVFKMMNLVFNIMKAAMVPPIQGTAPTEEDYRNAQPAYGSGGAVLDWPIDARDSLGGGGHGPAGEAML